MKKLHLFVIGIVFSVFVSAQENKTDISPYFNARINYYDNSIYCSTFQIAWNKLKDINDGDIILKPESVMADSLNNGEDAKRFINEKNYLISSGIATKQFIDETNKRLKKKFGNKFSAIDDVPNQDDYIIYAFLYKKLKFNQKFEKIKNGLYFFDKKRQGNRVEAFGINKYKPVSLRHKRLKKRVHLFIESFDEFVVILDTKNKDEQLIISQIDVDSTLTMYDAYKKIIKLTEKSPTPLEKKMRLEIPVVEFDFNKTFDELIGKCIQNSKTPFFIITEAKQYVNFKLNQKGAEVKSRAKIKLTRGVSSIGGGGYHIIFNRPFFIIMKEKDADFPYLMIWVANAGLLKKK